MTFEEKMNALDKELRDMCCGCYDCANCFFYDENDNDTPDEYACGIRDHNNKIPYHDNWNMSVALGFEEYKPVPLPDEIVNSMMQHFTRGE
jgi:hypothetical protein